MKEKIGEEEEFVGVVCGELLVHKRSGLGMCRYENGHERSKSAQWSL